MPPSLTIPRLKAEGQAAIDAAPELAAWGVRFCEWMGVRVEAPMRKKIRRLAKARG